MKTNRLSLFILVVIFFTYNSCKKDDVSENNSTSNASQYFGNTVSITAKGRIIDANGNGIAGAIVKGGSSLDTTDIMGVFQLSSFVAYENLGCVTVEKPGFFKGVRSFVPKSGGNELLIRLLTKSNIGTINSVNGGTVTASSIKLTLPANGVQLNNAAYNGAVNVAIKHINPTSSTFFEEMPGSLVGVDGNQSSVLTSYGMVGVELTDNSGQKLQIANGKTAEVRFEVPASLLSSAPATIDLWSLDEVNGYWKKEGAATLVNNEYVAQVSHFSFWNCDVQTSCVHITGQVVFNQNHLPVAGATVTISSLNDGARADITNSQGVFSGAVPLGQSLVLTISIQCNGSPINVYSSNIGPFAFNTSLTQIQIAPLSTSIISGTILGCNNQPLTNSYISINGKILFTNNGLFTATSCGNAVAISSFSFNPFVMGQTQTISLIGGVQNTSLHVCDSLLTNTITDIDGNVYSTIVIGSQEWMKENLKTTHYKNGILIPNVTSNSIWTISTSGACTDYNNDPINTAVYGKLYNGYAVADSSGLCPSGWHVPGDVDWNTLIYYLDTSGYISGNPIASYIGGGMLKEVGVSHWLAPNTGATNVSGFSALPSGLRNYNGVYNSIGVGTVWWNATMHQPGYYYCLQINYGDNYIHILSCGGSDGLSVRCVKD